MIQKCFRAAKKSNKGETSGSMRRHQSWQMGDTCPFQSPQKMNLNKTFLLKEPDRIGSRKHNKSLRRVRSGDKFFLTSFEIYLCRWRSNFSGGRYSETFTQYGLGVTIQMQYYRNALFLKIQLRSNWKLKQGGRCMRATTLKINIHSPSKTISITSAYVITWNITTNGWAGLMYKKMTFSP